MGLISGIARALFARGGVAEIGRVGAQVAEVFRPNATRRMELGHDAFTATQAAYAAEFRAGRAGWFDGLVNGLNRLPRPMLALGTLGLFAYAMADPAGFAVRMRGLAEVPEPLWWLLGAVVAFYFGARETHYLRGGRPVTLAPGRAVSPRPVPAPDEGTPPSNPALAEWEALQGR
ncbi:holin family protein [Rhodobacter sp. NTK016B]|uniref:holin family protein n=1 Tax=Rhodobacter sp. NTK016B TaxID=2759676 RepID=UPI001A8C7DA8|nr:holin family protein [Rhodobacter sp. NTK016B]MBN8291415.1 holin family protein [Rhodobacter sp. NTK016B]